MQSDKIRDIALLGLGFSGWGLLGLPSRLPCLSFWGMLSTWCRESPKGLGGHNVEREGDVDKAHDDPGLELNMWGAFGV